MQKNLNHTETCLQHKDADLDFYKHIYIILNHAKAYLFDYKTVISDILEILTLYQHSYKAFQQQLQSILSHAKNPFFYTTGRQDNVLEKTSANIDKLYAHVQTLFIKKDHLEKTLKPIIKEIDEVFDD